MASWLVHSSLDRAVQVRALAGDIAGLEINKILKSHLSTKW